MKLIKNFIIFLTILFLSSQTFAENVDQFLRTVDLTKLVGDEYVLNLEAQMKRQGGSTNNIDQLNQFIALVTDYNVGNTKITEFDSSQNITKQVTKEGPWIGVARFKQSEIPANPLQEGIQVCKDYASTNKIARVTIYKTQNTSQIIYDYAFKLPGAPSHYCQEVLYTPATRSCELGMVVKCEHHYKSHP